jgi:hypothetical protein
MQKTFARFRVPFVFGSHGPGEATKFGRPDPCALLGAASLFLDSQPSPPLFYSLVFVIIAMILPSSTSLAEKLGSAFADTSENSKCGGLLLGPQEDHDAEIEMADTEPPALVPVSFASMFRYLQSLSHTTRLFTAV